MNRAHSPRGEVPLCTTAREGQDVLCGTEPPVGAGGPTEAGKAWGALVEGLSPGDQGGFLSPPAEGSGPGTLSGSHSLLQHLAGWYPCLWRSLRLGKAAIGCGTLGSLPMTWTGPRPPIKQALRPRRDRDLAQATCCNVS